MSLVDRVVGDILSSLVRHEYEVERDSALLLRLVGFEPTEITVALEQLDPDQWPEGRGVTLKVATHERWDGAPSHWFLAEDETLVTFRNDDSVDLVIFEVEDQPDSQSMRNFQLIRDGTILEPSKDDRDERRRREVVERAWRAAGGGPARPLPEDLHLALEEVFHIVEREADQVALRAWVEFVLVCCHGLADCSGAVGRGDVQDAVVAAMPQLRLFHDDGLFSSDGAQQQKRLVVNVRLAGMNKPNGRELDESDLERRIEAATFRDADGEPLGETLQSEWRTRCRDLLHDRRPESYAAIPLGVWEQIFENDVESKSGLGTRIRDFLVESHPGRVDEYEASDLQTPLDDQDPTAAKTLLELDAQQPGEPKALIDLLNKPLRKAVEKLATPRSPTVVDPLAELLQQLHRALVDHSAEVGHVELALESSVDERCAFTLALFRFLYGKTLREIQEGEGGVFDVAMTIDSRLIEGRVDFLEVHRAHMPTDAGDADEDSPRLSVDEFVEAQWADIRLSLASKDNGEVLGRFSWSVHDGRGPAGYPAFARLILEGDVCSIREELPSLEYWCEYVRDPTNDLRGDCPRGSSLGPVDEWCDLRSQAFAEWRKDGLSVASLTRYVDSWADLLVRARNECVPAQESHPGLEAFLQMETFDLGRSRFVLLATHPIRLRWIAAQFEWLRHKIRSVLEGAFRLNPEVDELFFEWLGEVSPHRQPPTFSPGHQHLAVATREYGWHEEYRSIVEGDAPSESWVGSIDGESIKALVTVVRRYVEAHPHKADGLSLLFISRDGEADHIEQLVKQIRSGDASSLTLTIHVVAPQSRHEDIARALERLGDEDRTQEKLLPSLRTILHSVSILESPERARDLGLDGQIDLVMVPNLLGRRTAVNAKTQRRMAGAFSPLFGDSTHDAAGPAGAGRRNVARTFLPFEGDDLLEGWSSLQVWRKTWTRTGMEDDDQVDFFSLQVLFTESAELFALLHDWGHWVVTLDPYVSRDQIEASDRRPEIITVQPKVGKNGRYTLVVSSSTGREFVVGRLSKRIQQELSVRDDQEAKRLAEQLYAEGRNFAPGVVLRALGLGRTTQELLGLVVARRLVEEDHPRGKDHILEAWLSLDELAHWFGGAHRQRADMLRVLAREVDGRVLLTLQIVEAKFREREDLGRGEQQLTRTLEVLAPAFCSPEEDAVPYADGELWRRELVAAIEQCAGRDVDGRGAAGLYVLNPDVRGTLPVELRNTITAGQYDVEIMETILCTIAAGDVVLKETKRSSPSDDHRWFRIGRSGFRRLLLLTGGSEAGGEGPMEWPDQDDGRAAQPETVGEGATVTARDSDSAQPSLPVGDGSPTEEPDEVSRGGLGRDELERRFQLVLNLFAEHKIPVERPPGYEPTEGPAFYEVRLRPGTGVQTGRVLGQDREIKLKLGLPQHLEIRGLVDRGAVVFQIPKEDDERYFIDTPALWKACDHPGGSSGALKTPIGEDARGAPVWLDLSDSDSPHLLIGGTTGSGKSVALESIIEGLCAAHTADHLQLFLIDPKQTELTEFEDRPHTAGDVGVDSDDAIALLEAQVEEMERRYKQFKALKAETGTRVRQLVEFNEVVDAKRRVPWHLIVLDEYADLTSDKASRQVIEPLLQRIAQKGRAAGIHVIVATQKPSAQILSTAIRSNLPAQLALRVKTASDSRIVMDETGAETLAGKGDAFLKTQSGIVRVQTARHCA